MLSGSLDMFGLEDVLRFVRTARVTGQLDVVRPRAAGTLLLDRGDIVGASRGRSPAASLERALDAAADLFEGTGGAFVLSRLAEPPTMVIDLEPEVFFAEMERRVQSRAAAQLLRELTEPHPSTLMPSEGAIHLDRPPVQVLTREEQRMRLRT